MKLFVGLMINFVPIINLFLSLFHLPVYANVPHAARIKFLIQARLRERFPPSDFAIECDFDTKMFAREIK